MKRACEKYTNHMKKNQISEKWLEIMIYLLLAIVLIGLSVCLIILTT
ncbi:hypothetical protein [uncultured Proteiniphilum sp.]|nr:hypothetical protein [uncultured Proteiniphilum sp.]